jgi:hypothetical protein
MLVTSAVIALCFLVKRHYSTTDTQLAKEDALFADTPPEIDGEALVKPDPRRPTALVLVGKHRGAGMHTLLWVERLYPGRFKSVIFLAVGEVDAQSYEGAEYLEHVRQSISSALAYYFAQSRRQGFVVDCRVAFGVRPTVEFMRLAETTMDEFPDSVCFASKLIFERANFLTAWLDDRTPVQIHRRLGLRGRQTVLIPMRVG